jgi:hypothetical protein
MPWKWHSITRLDDFPSQNQPIDFAEQGFLLSVEASKLWISRILNAIGPLHFLSLNRPPQSACAMAGSQQEPALTEELIT